MVIRLSRAQEHDGPRKRMIDGRLDGGRTAQDVLFRHLPPRDPSACSRTVARPRVIVPVLSNAARRMRSSASSTAPLRSRFPVRPPG